MSRRAVLVTFDAFSTLFSPRLPVPVQYANVAQDLGVHATPEDIEHTFLHAFKSMSRKYPNYGKSVDMKPERWWTEIITSTFSPLHHESLPPALAPSLIQHFSTSAAYAVHPTTPPLLHALRCSSSVIIGVISNSDPRVSSILRSLKVEVDFVTLSYDVGFEKPDTRIFRAAEKEARDIWEAKSFEKQAEWKYVHVGDDVTKDVEGAEKAGWKGILWDGEGGAGTAEEVCEKILNEE